MTAPGCVYRFDRAIVRRPGKTVVRGLRAVDRGDPDFGTLCREHDAYVQALRSAGVEVTVLPELEAWPDAIFVEDPALVFTGGAIVLRARAATRSGEADELAATLHDNFDRVVELPGNGFVDGGDVLVTPRCVMIGLSSRTDRQGAGSLIDCLRGFGLEGRMVATPRDVLHLKSDCALLDDETVLATPRLAASGMFDEFDVVATPPGEEAAANTLRVNDVVFAGDRFPRTLELLDRRGYRVVPLQVGEVCKLDAGLSCMSLRWRRCVPRPSPGTVGRGS